ncbi:DUF3388 domain-containing protein [Fodinisporobacter ferrooxydans]|uniref:DUF3388 domain-containing protein n=1 Tax=Fodinisporobacter ferrooxydans TaxID=2901836 RepID=A0ABY4CNI1_9BACL|nr:DUF3388 domain-containing protein [Alicyclobacillaceae bacterium MYW30-H2]
MEEWYLEYRISKDRPGLLGDIASLLGMLSINIVTISGVEGRNRGFLLQTDDIQKIEALRAMFQKVENVTVTAFRQPTLMDRIALRHGVFIERESEPTKTYKFTRDHLGILVDFLGELMKRPGHQVIGVRGMPRVGKTESIVAACVYANKRWTFLSSTLLKQTLRTQLTEDELNIDQNVYIIDGIVSTSRENEQHRRLMREILHMEVPKVIEHPDVFIKKSNLGWDYFDRVIELRNDPSEVITYEHLDSEFQF